MTDPAEMVQDIRDTDGVSGGITLSEWESEFVDSIENQLHDERTLTQKQRDVIERIWDRI